jgi:hypothetical protein
MVEEGGGMSITRYTDSDEQGHLVPMREDEETKKNLFRCTYYSKEGCCAPVGESVVLCDVCEHTDNSSPSNESEKQNNPYEEEKLIKDALPSETYAHYGRFGSIKRGRKL